MSLILLLSSEWDWKYESSFIETLTERPEYLTFLGFVDDNKWHGIDLFWHEDVHQRFEVRLKLVKDVSSLDAPFHETFNLASDIWPYFVQPKQNWACDQFHADRGIQIIDHWDDILGSYLCSCIHFLGQWSRYLAD